MRPVGELKNRLLRKHHFSRSNCLGKLGRYSGTAVMCERGWGCGGRVSGGGRRARGARGERARSAPLSTSSSPIAASLRSSESSSAWELDAAPGKRCIWLSAARSMRRSIAAWPPYASARRRSSRSHSCAAWPACAASTGCADSDACLKLMGPPCRSTSTGAAERGMARGAGAEEDEACGWGGGQGA